MTSATPPPSPPASGQRLADRVYGQVLEFIVEQHLGEGDRLPSEHELCRRTGASRPIVREALNRLQADGLVEARRGAGSYIRQRPAEHLIQHLRPAEVLQRLQGFEARLPLEMEAARLAALRRGEAQVAEIRRAAEAYRTALGDGLSAATQDFRFHRAIAEAAGNEAFALLLDRLQEVADGLIVTSLSLNMEAGGERAALVAREHHIVVDAIAAGDGDWAAAAMRLHLLNARQRVRVGRF